MEKFGPKLIKSCNKVFKKSSQTRMFVFFSFLIDVVQVITA
jgi:hypothetical protein